MAVSGPVASPLWAVLAAHLQASRNRLLRQLGINGLVLLLVAVALISVFVIIPIVFGLSVGAFFLARSAFAPEGNPELGSVVGLILTAVAIGGGVIGGVAGGAKQLEWEQYRVFPLRPVSLFFAEVLAGLGDAITLVEAAALFGVCLATAAAAPHLSVVMFFLAIQSVLLLLCVQLLVGSFAERIVKRLRIALVLAFVLALVSSQLLATRATGPSPLRGAGLRRLGEGVLELASYLPASQALHAAHLGQWQGLLSSVLLLAGALLVAFLVLLQEREAPVVDGGGQSEKLWSHSTPTLNIARLQLGTLLGSHLGKFAFAMPLITLVLVRGPFSELANTGPWLIPGAFIYISLAANGLGFNQFGLDGHGVKALFLLPISERTILEGKQLGFAGWQALQALLLGALLLLVQRPHLDELLAGMMLFACYFFLQTVVGQRTSIWLPRRMLRTSMKNSQIPLPVVLISLATSVLGGLLFGTLWWALSTFARPLLLPGMMLIAIASCGASRPFVGLNAQFLARNRERIIEGVG